MTTLVTLKLDPKSQERFEALRRIHFPPERNLVPAHVSLFHALPNSVEQVLEHAAAAQASFPVTWTGLRSLGRGVAYVLLAPELAHLHRQLAQAFHEHLSPQDRQPFRPHLVIQNKAIPEHARTLFAQLEQQPLPEPSRAVGLDWWEYLGGPWRLLRTFEFQPHPGP